MGQNGTKPLHTFSKYKKAGSTGAKTIVSVHIRTPFLQIGKKNFSLSNVYVYEKVCKSLVPFWPIFVIFFIFGKGL